MEMQKIKVIFVGIKLKFMKQMSPKTSTFPQKVQSQQLARMFYVEQVTYTFGMIQCQLVKLFNNYGQMIN